MRNARPTPTQRKAPRGAPHVMRRPSILVSPTVSMARVVHLRPHSQSCYTSTLWKCDDNITASRMQLAICLLVRSLHCEVFAFPCTLFLVEEKHRTEENGLVIGFQPL